MVKNPPANAGDVGLIPGSGDPLEEGMATRFSILAWRIPMDRGAWRAPVRGVSKILTRLSTHAHMLKRVYLSWVL